MLAEAGFSVLGNNTYSAVTRLRHEAGKVSVNKGRLQRRLHEETRANGDISEVLRKGVYDARGAWRCLYCCCTLFLERLVRPLLSLVRCSV